LNGVAFANKEKGNHIIVSAFDHDCVLNSAKWLGTQGFDITYIGVDNEGFVDPEKLRKAIKKETILVSIIHGNNEVGTVQDLKVLGEVCKEKNVVFHTDACQSFTKVPIDVKDINIDLITINAHKIHGPKGIGALYIKKGTKITPFFHGGGHEYKKRAGTENVPGAVGFRKAVEISEKIDFEKITKLRDHLIKRISEEIPHVTLTGPKDMEKRLCNNANFLFKFIEGEGLLMHLDIEGIAVSTGSACSSHSLEPSHVMIALGYKHEESHGSIRFTLSKYTTKEEIDYTVDKLKIAVEKLRKLSPLNENNIDDDHNYTDDDHDHCEVKSE
jgi:cysteine desulfurase